MAEEVSVQTSLIIPPPPPRVPGGLMHKNRLQEYAQKSSLPLPVYTTVNEGAQHAPKFRATVLVDGTYYTSKETFSNRKSAEQDAAKIALQYVKPKVNYVGFPVIREDTIFCKSILNEYAVKMRLDKPVYNTIRSGGLIPVFVSSLVFNGVSYTGDKGRNKKEAEQLAARAVILSIIDSVDSASATVMSEIFRSKYKLYAALNKIKDTNSIYSAAIPVVNTSEDPGVQSSKRKEAEVNNNTGNLPITAICGTDVAEPAKTQAAHLPLHQFKKPKSETDTGETIAPPIVFVPPVLGQSLLSSTSGAKQNRKNKKVAKKQEGP
ncbi:hypothetical protein ACH5RR_013888 [Cinchona calisaya]|uniref:DRBM domain-containing protein n=1 Tax=Cinchona calisaya TaxID=153742 RepID=A0ABD3A1B6_9GENT